MRIAYCLLHWQRALAFQQAVEQRAFAMYKKFFDDLQCTGV